MDPASVLTKRALVELAVELPTLAAAAMSLGRSGAMYGAGELHDAMTSAPTETQPTTGQRIARLLRTVVYAGGSGLLGAAIGGPMLRGPIGRLTAKLGPEVRLGPVRTSADQLARLLAGGTAGYAGSLLGRRLQKAVHPQDDKEQR